MAYVGTPSYLGDDTSTLASIIYGEAGNQGTVGMQAVGAVIANRASTNLNGYGSNIISQALAPNQFQGQSPNYSPQAYAVAQSVINGTNPDPTGGALYYANPGASSASWARNLNSSNSVQIGSHYFTNNTNGTPFTGSGATTANIPGSSLSMGGTEDQQNATFLSAYNQGVGADTPNLQDSDFDGLSDSDVWGGSSTVPGSVTNTGGALQGTPNLGGGVSQTGTNAATPTNAGQSLGAGGGQPVNITDLPGLDTSVTGAGSAVQQGATTAGTDVETAAGGIAGTAASIFNNLQGYASGAVVVIALVILGLIFVAFGLGMFKHNLLPQAA